jgi:hypothetical protein
MVKQARSADLQKAVKKAKLGKISGWIEFITGSVLLSIGFNFFVASISYWLIFGGLVLAIFGLYSITTNVRKESLLLKEPQSMPKRALKCSSCGRKIPQESFDYCPFCGHPLKHATEKN